MQNKGLAIWQLIVHVVLIKQKRPLDQFIKGLKALNLLSLIISNPEHFARYFTFTGVCLNIDIIKSLFIEINVKQEDQANEEVRIHFLHAIEDLGNGKI